MRQFCKILKMLLSSIFTSTRETARPVTIIMESPCSQLQARPWPEFYSTASLYILREVSCQRASAASRKKVGLSTWCLLLDSSKRSVRNRMLTYTPPMLIWPRPLTLSSKDGLWRIMAKYECPQKFIAIVCQLHDGMLVRVQDNGEISQPLPVSALCFLPCWCMLSEILM